MPLGELQQELEGLEPDLKAVLLGVAGSVAEIAGGFLGEIPWPWLNDLIEPRRINLRWVQGRIVAPPTHVVEVVQGAGLLQEHIHMYTYFKHICTHLNYVPDFQDELKSVPLDGVGSTNAFGDHQLQADVVTDEIIFRHMCESGCVESVSSEELPEVRSAGGKGFSVAYDPLDGSSIFPANFAVGTIVGVWPGGEMVGRQGKEQCAAAYALYGPRTVLVIARPISGGGGGVVVQEFTLSNSLWVLTKNNVCIGEASYFAPGNVRCVVDNEPYKSLILDWMNARYTLRYSGGMVPDVHHILTKGGGVFCSPASASAPAKLRLLYECAPLAFVVQACGGVAFGPSGPILDQIIRDTNERSSISLGSRVAVEKSAHTLWGEVL